MNSVPSRPSVHQAMLRPIMSFIYYRLCVVYLKYWNIQILSYRKNKYMSTRFSHFTFPWSSSDSSLSDSRENFSWIEGLSNIRAPPCGGVRWGPPEPCGRGHHARRYHQKEDISFFVILWGTTSGFWRIRFRTIFRLTQNIKKLKKR